MGTFNAGWYLLYTRPRQELKVSELLLKNKIESFLPLFKSTRQWHDRRKIILMPYFPNYLFIHIKATSEFSLVLATNGVCSFVKFGTRPAQITEDTIKKIKLVVSNGENVDVLNKKFSKGEVLKIETGVFQGLFCEVVEHEGGRKILVRVDILNRSILLDIPASFVLRHVS
jgi:transcriptional antiterminator RfaH